MPYRPLSASARRVLILGLDGATFDVLDPLMAEGRMENLRRAISGGVSGVLHSTVPPITPAAWTTFLTGKQPGTHGILDFERYDPAANRLRFNSTRTLDHVRNLWQILGEQGLRVGSINVPMTYPAVPVNGVMISGFETPSHDSDFVYPSDFKAEVLSRWPDPTLGENWRRSMFARDRAFNKSLDYIRRSFDQALDMTRVCAERFGWDVLMVVLKLVDNLQHKAWKYLDPRWRDRWPARRDAVKNVFEHLDRVIGRFLEFAAENDATVLIVSDHGHGALEGKVQPNLLLKEWGYLHLREGGAQGATRGRYLWDRFLGRTGKFTREGDIAHDLAVDFARTRACVMHAGMAGFLYINLKGRQPCGIVEPSDYERLRDALRGRFLGPECQTADPSGRRVALFEAVHKPEELYPSREATKPRSHEEKAAQTGMPDLMLIPHRPLAVVRKIRGARAVRWLPLRSIEGTHRPEGIFVATGPGIARGRRTEQHIVDCAPTILAMLGLRIPDDMEGRVLTDLFETPPVIAIAGADDTTYVGTKTDGTAPTQAGARVPTQDEVFSDQDLAKVTQRLSDLGYLE